MPSIDIRHRHPLEPRRARVIVEEMAETMAQKFATRWCWRGDTLTFSRPGVDGTIAIKDGEIHFQAQLGLMLAGMKPVIERETRRMLEDRFTPNERPAQRPT